MRDPHRDPRNIADLEPVTPYVPPARPGDVIARAPSFGVIVRRVTPEPPDEDVQLEYVTADFSVILPCGDAGQYTKWVHRGRMRMSVPEWITMATGLRVGLRIAYSGIEFKGDFYDGHLHGGPRG